MKKYIAFFAIIIIAVTIASYLIGANQARDRLKKNVTEKCFKEMLKGAVAVKINDEALVVSKNEADRFLVVWKEMGRECCELVIPTIISDASDREKQACVDVLLISRFSFLLKQQNMSFYRYQQIKIITYTCIDDSIPALFNMKKKHLRGSPVLPFLLRIIGLEGYETYMSKKKIDANRVSLADVYQYLLSEKNRTELADYDEAISVYGIDFILSLGAMTNSPPAFI